MLHTFRPTIERPASNAEVLPWMLFIYITVVDFIMQRILSSIRLLAFVIEWAVEYYANWPPNTNNSLLRWFIALPENVRWLRRRAVMPDTINLLWRLACLTALSALAAVERWAATDGDHFERLSTYFLALAMSAKVVRMVNVAVVNVLNVMAVVPADAEPVPQRARSRRRRGEYSDDSQDSDYSDYSDYSEDSEEAESYS